MRRRDRLLIKIRRGDIYCMLIWVYGIRKISTASCEQVATRDFDRIIIEHMGRVAKKRSVELRMAYRCRWEIIR